MAIPGAPVMAPNNTAKPPVDKPFDDAVDLLLELFKKKMVLKLF